MAGITPWIPWQHPQAGDCQRQGLLSNIFIGVEFSIRPGLIFSTTDIAVAPSTIIIFFNSASPSITVSAAATAAAARGACCKCNSKNTCNDHKDLENQIESYDNESDNSYDTSYNIDHAEYGEQEA